MRTLSTLALALFALTACTAGGPSDGGVIPRDGGASDAGHDAPSSDAAVCTSVVCGAECCADGERCAYGACVIDLGPCTRNDDCSGDSYCDASGRCTPYGVPADVTRDPDCARTIEISAIEPTLQCRGSGPPAGDPFEGHRQVYTSPMIADFDLDHDGATLRPSIVVTTFSRADPDANKNGILRVLDGRTCTEQASLTSMEDRLVFASQNAIGDLDGAPDGRPEIVGTALSAIGVAGGLVAFRYDPDARRFERLWYSRRCDLPGEPRHMPNGAGQHHGPSIHDLDDDGSPEVLLERFVYDARGCLLNPTQEPATYQLGSFAVVADVDADGAPELLDGAGVLAWRGDLWEPEPTWSPSGAGALAGHTAVADFGDFPGTTPGQAEIVTVSTPTPDATDGGSVRVQTILGDIVFGPIPLVGDPPGRGGAPTIADFDGDGRPEIGVAGATRYTVFDPDCDIPTTSGPGCERSGPEPRGILWTRPVQDRTSNATGSSVFDFDADGVAEVIYGDECFVRIFRGTDGEILFSTSASTRTGYEYPVIADVDGDFNTELVAALTEGSSTVRPCPSVDPYFTRYPVPFRIESGIIVLRDAEDHWAASRPIWNQHAYAVTHVRDDGTVPRTSEWMANHADPTLNNFRQNAQGALEREGLADLTVALANIGELCASSGASVSLSARVCNRGTNPVADGARVVFYEGDPAVGAAPIACETTVSRSLSPGECAEVGCLWTPPPGFEAQDVHLRVDPDGTIADCHPGNNAGVIARRYCELI